MVELKRVEIQREKSGRWGLESKKLAGNNDAGQYLYAGGKDPETSSFCLSFEANKKRRGYYQVVMRMRERKKD